MTGKRLELGCRRHRIAALPRRGHDGRRKRVLAGQRYRGGRLQQRAPAGGRRGDYLLYLGAALGEGAGLVHHQGIHRAQQFAGGGVLEQYAERGAAPGGYHDRHRGGQSEGARAGDDQHRHGVEQRDGAAGAGTEYHPHREGEAGNGDHRRHEDGGDRVGDALNRRPAALRFRHHLHDAGQQGIGAYLGGADLQRTGAVDRTADHLGAGLFRHRDAFTGDHRLVDGAATGHHDPVYRHFLPRPYPKAIADGDRVERHVLLAALLVEAVGGRRGQLQQRAERRSGAPPSTQLQHLAKQHQGGNRSRALEVVQGNRGAGPGRRSTEDAGRQRRRYAVEVGDRDAEADQGEHVETAVDDGSPGALEEGSGAPQHHGGGQRQLQPPERRMGRRRRERQRHQQRGEDCTHHQPAGHGGELAAVIVGNRHRARLQRHAAQGAGPGAGFIHFRVHRTGKPPRRGAAGNSRNRSRPVSGQAIPLVMVAVPRLRAGAVLVLQVALRRRAEPSLATCRAEPIGAAAVLNPMRAVRRHGHAAHRVKAGHAQNSSTACPRSSHLNFTVVAAYGRTGSEIL